MVVMNGDTALLSPIIKRHLKLNVFRFRLRMIECYALQTILHTVITEKFFANYGTYNYNTFQNE